MQVAHNAVGAERERADDACAPVMVLQGPVGGFFGAMARQMRASGIDVVNIHFNLADRLFKSGGRNLVYSGREDEWGGWLERQCREQKPCAIILFGDRRPMHIIACRVAEALNIPLYSFEEGYLRPDFVTFERGGNNARSPLQRHAAAYQLPVEPEIPVRRVGQSFWSMTAAACGYFVLLRAGRAAFPHYRHHRTRPLLREALAWLRNVARKVRSVRPDSAQQARLVSEKTKKFFVVALQVHDDLQAVHHGAGWSQERLIENAILSFAAHAPNDTELVLRCHPLDRGHRSYNEHVRRVASGAGVVDRVQLLQSGHGPTLLMHAAGLVTVNSTMALSALHHGCPVYALGETFYRIPGLVGDGQGIDGLDEFWQRPGQPDPVLVKAFAAHLRRHTLIPGSFYRRRHWPCMVRGVLQRLAAEGVLSSTSAEPVNQPPSCMHVDRRGHQVPDPSPVFRSPGAPCPAPALRSKAWVVLTLLNQSLCQSL
jgi:capsular polysaccharide export protein